MARVEILMSTYNGEKFIEEQIKSIFSQKKHEVHLLIRDDGSKDNTIEIVKRLKRKFSIDFYSGENLGPAKSFMDLVYHCGEADYYAFADQDDIWNLNKIGDAINFISARSDEPAAYCSNLTPAKDSNTILQDKLLSDCIATKYTQILSRCSDIFGCTMVWNKDLQNIIVSLNPPKELAMHDYWIALIAACYGVMLYDKDYKLLYRQHENNSVGAGISKFRNWKGRLAWIFNKTKFSAAITAEEMLNVMNQNENFNREFYEYTKLLKDYKNSIFSKYKYLVHADMSAMNFKQKCFHVLLVVTSSL